MTQHSILPPSSAARRVACPGSRALEARYPREDTPESREGTAAHIIATYMLRGSERPGELSVADIEVTDEMIEGAEMYRDEIYRYQSDPEKLNIEQRVNITEIHSDCFGTPDCWYWDAEEYCLYIWDYKYGHGFVEVFENWQLIEYAAGILGHPEVLNIEDCDIEFCIVQPRSYHRDGPIRKWKISAIDLCPYFDKLEATETLAMQLDAPCRPNPECNYCSARHACEALQRSALTSVDISTENTPHELTATAVGSELRYLQRAQKQLIARITGLEEQAKHLIGIGQRVPYFALERGSRREIWTVEPDEIITLGELMGADLAKSPQVCTPKQAIKLKVPEEVVRQYSHTPPGDLRLVPQTERGVRKMLAGGSKK